MPQPVTITHVKADKPRIQQNSGLWRGRWPWWTLESDSVGSHPRSASCVTLGKLLNYGSLLII